MNSIYVVLSATPTKIGKFIRAVTKSSFNHASISLSRDLSEMYSFARYRARNALVGGFIKEFPERLTLGKDRSVQIKVYRIPVSDKQYNQVKSFIYSIRDCDEKYIYNSLAVLGRPFGVGYNTYKAYVCTDFVIRALMQGGLEFNSTRLTPGQMEEVLQPYLYYSGTLHDYNPASESRALIEEFFRRYSLPREMAQAARHFYSLIKRSYKRHEA
jgi:hypothetical protein